MTPAIPDHVRLLVHEKLATMEHVEVLLRMKAASEPLAPAEAARDAQCDPDAMPTLCRDLVRAGLAAVQRMPDGEERYVYAPANDDLRKAVDDLADAYRTRPVSLIRLVYERPADPAKSFADAFNLRKGSS